MTRHYRLPAAVLLALVFTLALFPDRVDAQPPDPGQKGQPQTSFGFSYTPLYQFETDLDSGGSFDVQRHFFRFDAVRFINRQWMVGAGLNFDYERWDFTNIGNLAGADLWDEIFRPGLSIPVFYNPGNQWRFGIIPAFDVAGATGAEIGESLSYGAVLSAAYTFSPGLTLGFGTGVFERLDQTEAFPFVVINWQITDRLELSNPFRAGPVGPAGIELVYTPGENWQAGIGGAYRSYRFRLDDSSVIADGIGQVDFWAPFLRAGRTLGKQWRLDLNGGATVGGSISIEDENANKLGGSDYDAAPFVGLMLQGKF